MLPWRRLTIVQLISLASCIQLDACTPNFIIQEHPSLDNKWDLGHEYLIKPCEIKGGYIEIPKGPGLGIEVNEESIRKLSYEGDWKSPLLYFEDDKSLGDW